jgi:hypothetical protein
MDDVTIRERRPLGSPTMVGGFLVRMHRRVTCPACHRIVRSSDAREIAGGIAVTCPHCHVDLLTCEAQ